MRIFDLGGDGTPRTATDRVLTVPNAVTLLRLGAVPFVVSAVLHDRFGVALLLLAVFASTDWIDGYLARALNQVSRFGALFDPAVDRIFIIATAVALFISGVVPLWAVLLVVVRDAAVLAIGAVLLARGVTAPPVSRVGKAGSFGVMCAALLIVAVQLVDGSVNDLLNLTVAVVFIASVIATYVATVGYARTLRTSVH